GVEAVLQPEASRAPARVVQSRVRLSMDRAFSASLGAEKHQLDGLIIRATWTLSGEVDATALVLAQRRAVGEAPVGLGAGLNRPIRPGDPHLEETGIREVAHLHGLVLVGDRRDGDQALA